MAVKTTKIQCNQDVNLRGKVDVEGDVTCGKNLEVDGQVTINSAKDLKTKDGSSFGGGDLPSPWVANENVLGSEDTENQLVIGFLTEGGNLYGYQNKQSRETSYVSPALSNSPDIVVYLNTNTQVESTVALPDDFVTKSQVINLGDINKKQAQLYHHTITLHNTTRAAYFTFDIDRTWQAEITEDTLFNLLNGYIVSGVGIMQDTLINKISFRNTAEKTKVHQYANYGVGGYVNAEVTFANVFGTDYTLEDLVQNP